MGGSSFAEGGWVSTPAPGTNDSARALALGNHHFSDEEEMVERVEDVNAPGAAHSNNRCAHFSPEHPTVGPVNKTCPVDERLDLRRNVRNVRGRAEPCRRSARSGGPCGGSTRGNSGTHGSEPRSFRQARFRFLRLQVPSKHGGAGWRYCRFLRVLPLKATTRMFRSLPVLRLVFSYKNKLLTIRLAVHWCNQGEKR
jgi:hypothetical protein